MFTVVCLRGHQWQVPENLRSLPGPTQLACPVCGSPPATDISLWLAGNTSVGASNTGTVEETRPTVSLPGAQDTLPAGTPVIPQYDLLGILGRGGMGVVYKARQRSLNRIVALKMLHAGIVQSQPALLERFKTEAVTIAQLQHPNIVQIYEIGEQEGRPFLALEYVDGGSLARWLKQTSLTPRQAAQLVQTIARAMHYAHQKGVIHRDLKPGNFLLSRKVEIQNPRGANAVLRIEDFQPKITDFGLVKRLDTEPTPGSELTRTGDILGTPSYMAPEQAAGLNRTLTPAVDIYALGAILYELLTSRPPFEGLSALHTVMMVLERDPVPPMVFRPRLPKDLQTICMTCLQKDPARRYPSAEALANDLQAFLSGEPIQARPPTTWERFTKMLKRRPLLTGLLTAGGVGLLGLLLGIWWYSAVAVGAVAVLSLLGASWWYNARLTTALRRIEQQQISLERNVERLHLLLETTRLLMTAPDLTDLLRLLSETTARMTGAERATIYLLDRERQELWSRVALGEGVGEIRISVGVGIAGQAAATGEVINLDDPYNDPRFNPEIDRRTGFCTRNLLTVPMRGSNGAMLGVFQVLNKRSGPFTIDDVEILQALAASAAVAIEKGERPGG